MYSSLSSFGRLYHQYIPNAPLATLTMQLKAHQIHGHPPILSDMLFFHKVWACAETAAGIAVAIDGATAILLELDHLVHCYGIAQP